MLHLDLDPGESVILEVRKHWFVFLTYGFSTLVAAIAPLILYGVLTHIISVPVSIQGNTESLAMFVYFLWLMFLWMGFFVQWTSYFLDVWYVTEKRIIDVEQKGMFHREVSSLRFDKIQDITIDVQGLLATFLNFGDIQVQTAAEDSGDFFMRIAANPENVRKVIFSHHNREAERTRPVSIVSHEDKI